MTSIPPHTDPWWERRRREALGLTVRLGRAHKDYEDEEFLLIALPPDASGETGNDKQGT